MTWKWVRRMLAAVLPWPSRTERKARIAAVLEGVAVAERKNAEAQNVKHDLEHIVAQNHFAQVIVDGLIEGQGGRGD